MTAARLAFDPLWQCLCPAWTYPTTLHVARRVTTRARPSIQCLTKSTLPPARAQSTSYRHVKRLKPPKHEKIDAILSPIATESAFETPTRPSRVTQTFDLRDETTEALYSRLRGNAIEGKVEECREIARMLVAERDERPSAEMYNALILSNVHTLKGSAWKVAELLKEMEEDGIQLDAQVCHSALKVLSIHLDHLLRADLLEYMQSRWILLSEDGAHDVAAGLVREGLFEQVLERLDKMREDGIRIKPWLLDMVVYALCEADEISEAYRIMIDRFEAGEQNISRNVWSFVLDRASAMRHHAATRLAWSTQVNQNYLNPSSGICLNILATAAQAADVVLATEVFTRLSKYGTPYQPIHYELLISAYLNADPPDLERALTILTIMALEKTGPSATETRAFYTYLRENPDLLPTALDMLKDLRQKGRTIPIAALNVLIESCVDRDNLSAALHIYSELHTFSPKPTDANTRRLVPNIDTFDLLLKGCRNGSPRDAEQATSLMHDLLELGLKPGPLTFDRLILVFVRAGLHALLGSEGKALVTDGGEEAREQDGSNLADPSDFNPSNHDTPDLQPEHGLRNLDPLPKPSVHAISLINQAMTHFTSMRQQNWLPRFGTIESLSMALARIGDERCWDVLHAGERSDADVWHRKGRQARASVEAAWREGAASGAGVASESPYSGVNAGGTGGAEAVQLGL